LRIVAGGAAASQGVLFLTQTGEPNAGAWVLGLAAIVSGAALIAGLFTPGAAVLASAVMVWLAVTGVRGTSGVHIDRLSMILIIVDGVALALLGPGAHSIDAHLFGRREIILPNDPGHRDHAR
jgi:putative oxidoreductase